MLHINQYFLLITNIVCPFCFYLRFILTWNHNGFQTIRFQFIHLLFGLTHIYKVSRKNERNIMQFMKCLWIQNFLKNMVAFRTSNFQIYHFDNDYYFADNEKINTFEKMHLPNKLTRLYENIAIKCIFLF